MQRGILYQGYVKSIISEMAQARRIIMEWNLICKSGPALKSKSFLVHFFADKILFNAL